MRNKNLGNICYVAFLGGALVTRNIKWGGPGQPLGLPMLMTTTVPCPYLPACIIPTFYHYGHELNSQILLTIYFCTRFFFCNKKFYIKISYVTKFCTFILACVVSLLSTINVQIFVTQTNVMQKVLM